MTKTRIQGYLCDRCVRKILIGFGSIMNASNTLSQGGQGGRHGKTGHGGQGAGHGRTGAGHGEHPPPGHTEQGLRSLHDAIHGFVEYG